MDHKHRKYRFTSSEIYKLIKKGRGNEFSAPGLTYIDEKRIENRIGRSLSLNAYSQVIAWGHLFEKLLFERLPNNYSLVSDETRKHPDPEFSEVWGGTPDFEITGTMISEAKCYQLKNFAKYTDVLLSEDLDRFKKEFPKEYWQIVSNVIINEVPYGEAVTFMPYRSELEQIRNDIEYKDVLESYDLDPWQFRFITEKPMSDLAWIEEGGYYKNINIFRFEVPTTDIDLLTERVRLAKELLK